MPCYPQNWQKKQAKSYISGDCLKRLSVLILVVFSFLLCSCNKATNAELDFVRKGIYTVQLEGTELTFSAVLDGEYQEYCFTAPSTVAGLKAISYDGVSFELDYQGIKQNAHSQAIKCATDFSAATELLDQAGAVNGNTTTANADGLKAKGVFENKRLTKLEFYDGKDTRIYKITTEATG